MAGVTQDVFFSEGHLSLKECKVFGSSYICILHLNLPLINVFLHLSNCFSFLLLLKWDVLLSQTCYQLLTSLFHSAAYQLRGPRYLLYDQYNVSFPTLTRFHCLKQKHKKLYLRSAAGFPHLSLWIYS